MQTDSKQEQDVKQTIADAWDDEADEDDVRKQRQTMLKYWLLIVRYEGQKKQAIMIKYEGKIPTFIPLLNTIVIINF